VKEKWVEVNVFCVMSNHIHVIWKINDGYERDAIQRNFLKFISQTIKRDLEKNHPKVLERFYVGAKDSPDSNREETQSFKCRFMDERGIYTP
jgi:REP element-mobilizing transposase RayT